MNSRQLTGINCLPRIAALAALRMHKAMSPFPASTFLRAAPASSRAPAAARSLRDRPAWQRTKASSRCGERSSSKSMIAMMMTMRTTIKPPEAKNFSKSGVFRPISCLFELKGEGARSFLWSLPGVHTLDPAQSEQFSNNKIRLSKKTKSKR